jgi:hypothetical protein
MNILPDFVGRALVQRRSFNKMATLGVLMAFFAAATADTFNDGAPSGDYESYGSLHYVFICE